MIGAELKTFTESILDGQTIDTDFFYQLLNIAKTNLEGERLWQFLKKSNSSNTAGAGNNYATAITLPNDFAEDYKILVGLDTEYFPVSFEEQYAYRNSSNRYYIDHGAGAYHLLGNSKAGTIYFFYKRFTDDITSSTSPVFPARFHSILGFYVASYFMSGVDVDDLFARMSPVNRAAAMELKRSMTNWDASLAMRAQNDQIGVANSLNEISVGDM